MSNYIGRGIDQIDNISTLDNLSFNGSDATFNLTQNSVAFTPVSADALQIQIDGIIQSGNYSVANATVTFDFTPSGSSVCNGIKHFGVGLITTPTDGSVTATKIGTDAVIQAKIGDEAVDEARLQISNAGTNGQFLSKQSSNSGGLTWASVSAGTALTGSTNNQVTTVTGANAIQGETNLSFDGTGLCLGSTTFSGAKINLYTGANAPANGAKNGSSIWFQNNTSSSAKMQMTFSGTSGSTYGPGFIGFNNESFTSNGKGYLTFGTRADETDAAPTERLRIHSNGVASFNNGIALGVGTANTASNVMDDYEHGDWTPTWVLGTSGSCNTANASGKYVKVGKFVTVWGYNAFGGTVSSPTGTIYVGGLPFTPASGYGQSNGFYGQGWVSGAWGWGNAGGSNNSASDGYHPRGLTVRTNGLELLTFGVQADKPWGPTHVLVGQTNTMYGGSSNHGQMYFGAVYRIA